MPSGPTTLATISPIRQDAADDKVLVQAAQGGDQAALETLLRRHYDRLYAICRRLAGNDADAQDAAQEALIAVTKGLSKYDGRASFKTWSYRVATNACLDELRRRGRRPTPAIVDEHEGMAEQMTSVTSVATSTDVAETITERMVIDDALRDLPEEFRAPIVLRDQCGMDYRDIAETLDLAPGTVRSRIARGRRKLAESLSAGNQTDHKERPT